MAISVSCGSIKSRCSQDQFKWQKEEKFHVFSSSFVSDEEEEESAEEFSLAIRPLFSAAMRILLRRETESRRSSVSTSSDSELPARLSVFKKLIPCSVDGKVKESFAIVKSQDPYEDFKLMMEMIWRSKCLRKNELSSFCNVCRWWKALSSGDR
ncbi:hypothetical protein HAX54_001638 [Datura stramonium]|uniref:Transcription repressor n=1 Tax=Datura stramonium TaxID=4076 RepID=A0ABS8T3B6_DATST|nr:hypothetical protein [Datura stramonium]